MVFLLIFLHGKEKNIHTLVNIYGEGGLFTFHDICTKFDTPVTSFFFYLQLRLSLRDSGVPIQGPLTIHPLYKLFCSVKGTTGLVSRLLSVLVAAHIQTSGFRFDLEGRHSRYGTVI